MFLCIAVLCRSFVKGLAIRDYWSLGKEDQKDDKYIVLVVDQFGGRGNILNFNVGDVSGRFAMRSLDQRRIKRPSWLLFRTHLFFCPSIVLLQGVKFALPNVFWTRLSGKYGTTFFVRDNGVDVAVENAVEAIVSCLRSEDGYCMSPPEQGQSLRSLGMK